MTSLKARSVRLKRKSRFFLLMRFRVVFVVTYGPSIKPLFLRSRSTTSVYALSGILELSSSEVSFKVTTGLGSKTLPLPSMNLSRLCLSRIAPVTASIYIFHSAGRRSFAPDLSGVVFTITFHDKVGTPLHL